MYAKSLSTRKFFFAFALAMGMSLMIPAAAEAANPGVATAAAPFDFDRDGTYEAPAVHYRPYLTSRPRADSRERAKKRWKKAWIASWIAFAAVNLLDAHSSTGRRELNPLLRNADGTFSGRKAAMVKAAVGGGFFAFQWWTQRRNPQANHYKAFTIATGAAAAGFGAVAVRNYGNAKVTGSSRHAGAVEYLRNPAAVESQP